MAIKKTQNYNFLDEDLFKAFPLLKFEHYLKYIIFNVPEDIFSVKEYLVVVDNYDEIGSYINVSKDDCQIILSCIKTLIDNHYSK